MIRSLCVALACAMLCQPAQAQEVKLPKTVSGDPGAWTIIVPDAVDGGAVKWRAGPGLTVVPIDKLFPGMKASGIVVQAPTGRYEVIAWCAKGDVASDLAVCTIVIGAPPPTPVPVPPPGPTPTPTPVPVPVPVPTAEMQAIVAPLQAFRGKPNADKVAAFYRDFGEMISKDSSITTNAKLRAVHVTAQNLLVQQDPAVAGSLPGLSAAVNAAMAGALGLEDVAINRPRAVETFRAIAWAMTGGV